MNLRSILVFLLGVAAACRSVELPTERAYALAAPAPAAGKAVVGTLRVDELQIGGGVDRDRPMVRRGVGVELRDTDRWLGPLDRLVTDAFVQGLQRSGVAGLVKGPYDGGVEDLWLHGRITEFAAIARGDALVAVVGCELWLECGGERRWSAAVLAEETVAGDGAAAIVEALSRALGTAVADCARRIRAEQP